MDSLNHYFRGVHKNLDRSLVNKFYSNTISKLTQLLPAAPISGIECRMKENDSRIDFSILIWPDKKNLELITGLSWKEQSSDPNYWKSIRLLCRKIQDPDSYLHTITKSIALEFDLEDEDKPFTDPLFFIILKPLPKLEQVRSSILMKLVDEIPNLFTEKARLNMVKCVELAPFDLNIYALGWMPSRDSNVIRYGIEVQFFEQLVNYLKDIDWPGDLEIFIQTFSPFIKYFTDSLVVGFDISEILGQRIGIEFRMESKDRKSTILDEFLNLCVDLKIASKQKCDSIIKWKTPTITGEKYSSEYSGSTDQPINMGIAYFKFVYIQGKPLELKAYLFFQESSRS